jgi:hypothetical protein
MGFVASEISGGATGRGIPQVPSDPILLLYLLHLLLLLFVLDSEGSGEKRELNAQGGGSARRLHR